MTKPSTVHSYIFHQPFNKTGAPFKATEAMDGHPVVLGDIDSPVMILSIAGGGKYPVIFMIPGPPGTANVVMRAAYTGEVENSNLKLFLLMRTVTQYIQVCRIGHNLTPGGKFYNTIQEAEKEGTSTTSCYAISPVEIPVPWEAIEKNPHQHRVGITDSEEADHEDA